MKKPITPWIPMIVSEGNDLCAVSMWDRTYTVDKNVLFAGKQHLYRKHRA